MLFTSLFRAQFIAALEAVYLVRKSKWLLTSELFSDKQTVVKIF